MHILFLYFLHFIATYLSFKLFQGQTRLYLQCILIFAWLVNVSTLLKRTPSSFASRKLIPNQSPHFFAISRTSPRSFACESHCIFFSYSLAQIDSVRSLSIYNESLVFLNASEWRQLKQIFLFHSRLEASKFCVSSARSSSTFHSSFSRVEAFLNQCSSIFLWIWMPKIQIVNSYMLEFKIYQK